MPFDINGIKETITAIFSLLTLCIGIYKYLKNYSIIYLSDELIYRKNEARVIALVYVLIGAGFSSVLGIWLTNNMVYARIYLGIAIVISVIIFFRLNKGLDNQRKKGELVLRYFFYFHILCTPYTMIYRLTVGSTWFSDTSFSIVGILFGVALTFMLFYAAFNAYNYFVQFMKVKGDIIFSVWLSEDIGFGDYIDDVRDVYFIGNKMQIISCDDNGKHYGCSKEYFKSYDWRVKKK